MPTPLPTPDSPLPTPIRKGLRKRGGWIEFREKNGRRYARRRSWQKKDGVWTKVFHGRVVEIPVMSEEQYTNYVNERERAKSIRNGR